MGPADVARLAAFLGCPPGELIRNRLERRNGKLYIGNGKDGNCEFFSAGKGCAVHAAKPAICRAWPFFRGNLLDAYSLALAKDYCPGIDRAANHAEFRRAGLAYIDSFGLKAMNPQCEAAALVMPEPAGGNS